MRSAWTGQVNLKKTDTWQGLLLMHVRSHRTPKYGVLQCHILCASTKSKSGIAISITAIHILHCVVSRLHMGTIFMYIFKTTNSLRPTTGPPHNANKGANTKFMATCNIEHKLFIPSHLRCDAFRKYYHVTITVTGRLGHVQGVPCALYHSLRKTMYFDSINKYSLI